MAPPWRPTREEDEEVLREQLQKKPLLSFLRREDPASKWVALHIVVVTGLTRQCLPMAHSSHTASTASSIPHHQYTPSPDIW